MKKQLKAIWDSIFGSKMEVTFQAETFDGQTTVGRVIHFSTGFFNDVIFENEIKQLVQDQLGKGVTKVNILTGREF